MILSILLGLWLGPAILMFFIGLPILMIKEHSFFPFDDLEDFLIGGFCFILWPLVVVMGIRDYRNQRKKKLTDVSEAIEIHYRDKWYE